MNISEGPFLQMLALMLGIALVLRLIFEIIAPVAPYVVAGAVVLGVVRLVSWYRNRW